MPILHTCAKHDHVTGDLESVLDHIDTDHGGDIAFHRTVFTPQAIAQGNPIRRIAWCPSCDRRHDMDAPCSGRRP